MQRRAIERVTSHYLTNNDQDMWRHCASLYHNKLTGEVNVGDSADHSYISFVVTEKISAMREL